MNGYQRINKVLNKELADRVPMMLHCFMPAAKELGYSMACFREDSKKMADSFAKYAKKYGLDGILTDMDTAIEAHAMGAHVEFPIDLPAKVVSGISGSYDEILKGIDPKKLLSDERVNKYLDMIRILRKEVGGEIFIRGNADQGPFSLAMLCYDMIEFLTDILDEEKEQLIIEVIERSYLVHLKFHTLVKEAGADCTSFGDSSSGPDMVAPNVYKKFAYPFHLRLKKDLENLNIKTICHICGNLDKILEYVASIEFAGIEMDYKTDIVNARNIVKDRSVVFGIIDPSSIFCLGSEKEIEEETIRVLDIFKNEPLVIGSGCALPESTPEKNIRAFVNAVINYRK